MSPPLLEELDRLIAATRRRLALRKLVRGGSIGLHLGLWLTALGALALSQIVHPKQLLATTGLLALVVLGVTLVLTGLATVLFGRLEDRASKTSKRVKQRAEEAADGQPAAGS